MPKRNPPVTFNERVTWAHQQTGYTRTVVRRILMADYRYRKMGYFPAEEPPLARGDVNAASSTTRKHHHDRDDHV